MKTTTKPEVWEGTEKFLAAWQAQRNNWEQERGYVSKDVFEVTVGHRYLKVISRTVGVAGAHVQAFIDRQTGDIYKPAGWSKPAKHVRGNVLSEQNGMEAIGGGMGHVEYLR